MRNSRMSESGRVALPHVREWSGDPAEGPGVVGGPLGCQGLFRRPSRMSGSNQEALPDVREW